VSVFNKKYPPGSVLRCPTVAENGGYDQGGCVQGGLTSSPASSPSQTLRRRLVRTTATDAAVYSTLAAVRRGFVFHSS